MAKYTHLINGVKVDFTPEEEEARDAEIQAWNDDAVNRKLAEIKRIRLQKLQDTDWYSNSDVTMPDNVKVWRQSLRDIPQTYTIESEYDSLLDYDLNGNLTNAIWSKP